MCLGRIELRVYSDISRRIAWVSNRDGPRANEYNEGTRRKSGGIWETTRLHFATSFFD